VNLVRIYVVFASTFATPVLMSAKNMLKWAWNIAGNVPRLAANVLPPVKKWQPPYNLFNLPLL
jgi:hypothetical protein